MNNAEMIFVIVNTGFTDSVMNAASKAGARGGTILNARGTANVEAEQFFGISISSEKEIVMIIVPSSIKDNVLHTIYAEAGLSTPGSGIAFSIPLEDVVGITLPSEEESKDEVVEEVKTKKKKPNSKL